MLVQSPILSHLDISEIPYLTIPSPTLNNPAGNEISTFFVSLKLRSSNKEKGLPHSLRVEAFKEVGNYKTAFVIKPYWWYQAQLKLKYPFVGIEEVRGYYDYLLPLTLELFKQIRWEQSNNLDGSVTDNTLGWKEIQKKESDKLDELLLNFNAYTLVRINIHEEDSFD